MNVLNDGITTRYYCVTISYTLSKLRSAFHDVLSPCDICLFARDVLPRATNFYVIATSSLFSSLIYIFQRAPGGILIQNFNAECPFSLITHLYFSYLHLSPSPSSLFFALMFLIVLLGILIPGTA